MNHEPARLRAIPSVRNGFDADDLPARRCWRRSELAILDREYPTGGTAAVHAHLPHRTRQTIRQIAHTRGIKRKQPHGQA